MRLTKLALALIAAPFCTAFADDWPQYRGPQRNDVSAETGLLKQWPEEGPKLRWSYENTGIGYSGPAIVGNRLYTIGGRGETEFLIALELPEGEGKKPAEAWAAPVGPLFEWQGNRWSAGPSSTPTVDGELVYALGGRGHLVCVRASDGKEVWKKDLPTELSAEVNPIGGGPKKLGWGFTWAPVIDGDRLLCLPGGPRGTVAALDNRTGEVLWRSADVTDQAAYTSPMLAEIGGVRQCVVLTNRGVYGIDTKDGRLLWKHLRERPYSTEVINSPIVRQNLVFVTVGAGQGCDLLRITKDGDEFQAEVVYSNRNMTNHHANVLLLDGHLYGYSDGKGWICQAFETGEIVWSERRKLRAGSVTYADERLYCYGEDNGDVVLVDATPAGWTERGRFTIPQHTDLRKPRGKIWTPPVVANGTLYLRDQNLLFAYDVSGK